MYITHTHFHFVILVSIMLRQANIKLNKQCLCLHKTKKIQSSDMHTTHTHTHIYPHENGSACHMVQKDSHYTMSSLVWHHKTIPRMKTNKTLGAVVNVPSSQDYFHHARNIKTDCLPQFCDLTDASVVWLWVTETNK